MKRKKFFCAVSVLLLLLLTADAVLAEPAADIAKSRQSITENKQKIETLRKEQGELKQKLSELSTLKTDVSKYIAELDGELKALEEKIQSLTGEIENTRAAIVDTEAKLSEAKKQEAEQLSSMKLRIRYTYEAGESDFFESVFGAGSIADILNKVEYVQKVSRYDREKLSEFTELREQITEAEEELEMSLSLLEEQERVLEEDRASLEETIAKKSAELKSYEQKISAANAEISSLSADVKKLNQAIQAEESAIRRAEELARKKEEEAKKAAEAKGETYVPKTIGNISFSWPCPSSSRITSYFGDRESPTAGASTNHKGIDIGAGSGSNILAAAGGTVTIATYSESAGNYVMISHGGGVCTVYMHMKAMNVSVGQDVSRGDVIGYVGSTGYSTGPHLHFGIRVDGSYVNPLNYVSP